MIVKIQLLGNFWTDLTKSSIGLIKVNDCLPVGTLIFLRGASYLFFSNLCAPYSKICVKLQKFVLKKKSVHIWVNQPNRSD
jgi:hypothetical protein